jgi:heat shock protein HslJ
MFGRASRAGEDRTIRAARVWSSGNAMNSLRRSSSTFRFAIASLACVLASACGHFANSGEARGADGVQRAATNATSASSPHTLAGTSWRFVRFQSSDESIVTPKDPAEYTLAFADGGKVSARIACNRGFGSWKSEAPGQLTLGPPGAVACHVSTRPVPGSADQGLVSGAFVRSERRAPLSCSDGRWRYLRARTVSK